MECKKKAMHGLQETLIELSILQRKQQKNNLDVNT